MSRQEHLQEYLDIRVGLRALLAEWEAEPARILRLDDPLRHRIIAAAGLLASCTCTREHASGCGFVESNDCGNIDDLKDSEARVVQVDAKPPRHSLSHPLDPTASSRCPACGST